MTTDLRRVLVVAAIGLLVLALVLYMRRSGTPSIVADVALTPGVLNAAVTQATIRSTICRRGWTRTVRPPTDYTNALKRKQMRVYHEHGPPSAYQEDHLISLELGGDPTDPRNLWPEPYPRASAVDRIENELNDQVCSGALSLWDAQVKEAQLKHTQG
jgi:hypothetical protein